MIYRTVAEKVKSHINPSKMEADWLRELKGSSVRLNKGVVLGRYLETSVPGIYGAGDAVETDNIRGSVFVDEDVVDPGVYLRMMRDQTDISTMINPVLDGTISHADLCPSVFKVALQGVTLSEGEVIVERLSCLAAADRWKQRNGVAVLEQCIFLAQELDVSPVEQVYVIPLQSHLFGEDDALQDGILRNKASQRLDTG